MLSKGGINVQQARIAGRLNFKGGSGPPGHPHLESQAPVFGSVGVYAYHMHISSIRPLAGRFN
jgi:hypothetical protein